MFLPLPKHNKIVHYPHPHGEADGEEIEAAGPAEYLQAYLRLEPGGQFADLVRSELARLGFVE